MTKIIQILSNDTSGWEKKFDWNKKTFQLSSTEIIFQSCENILITLTDEKFDIFEQLRKNRKVEKNLKMF